MGYNEADVRDSLAGNLDLIEPSLETIDTELHLKNAHGAKGFIDIFARDRLHNVVVIEVKREDQSARQAIQEVLKYAELLQREKGYPMHRIRLIIASTHWHELRVPFSALARFCPYPLLGIHLTVDADGTVTSASAVEGLPLSVPGEIAVEQLAFLWNERVERDGAWKLIAPVLSRVGLDDSLGIELDYKAAAHRPHPFALLFVPGRIPAERAIAAGLLGADEIAPGVSLGDLEDDEDLGDLDTVESEALYRLLEEAKGLPNTRSVVHPMGPEKLIAERQQGWVVGRVHRAGVFAAASERSDEELVAAVEARDGLNRVVFDTAVNSGHRLAWEEASIRADAVLEGNDDWQRGLAAWLTERESEEPRDYRLRIYHPYDIVSALIALVRLEDQRRLDQLHVAAGDSASPDVDLGGTIVWGRGGVDLVTAIERTVPGGMSDFPFKHATGAPLFQLDLMRELDLRYVLFEQWKGQDPSTLAPDGTRAGLDLDNFVPISRFAQAHHRAIQDVAQAIDNITY